MNYFFRYFGKFFKFIFRFKKFLPGSVAGIFLVWEFFKDLTTHNVHFALENLSRSVLACELVINQKVNLAITKPLEYGLSDFFEIMTSVFILYTLIIFLLKLFQFTMTRDIAKLGAYIIIFVVIFIVEYYAVKMMGHDGFIPFKDGILFLVLNASPVFNNIFGPSYTAVQNATNASAQGFFTFFLGNKYLKTVLHIRK